MIQHQVGNDSDVAFPGLRHQALEVRHGSVLRVDGGVVGYVVPEIHLRRRIERSDPDGIHAEISEIIQMPRDPVQVAYREDGRDLALHLGVGTITW